MVDFELAAGIESVNFASSVRETEKGDALKVVSGSLYEDAYDSNRTTGAAAENLVNVAKIGSKIEALGFPQLEIVGGENLVSGLNFKAIDTWHKYQVNAIAQTLDLSNLDGPAERAFIEEAVVAADSILNAESADAALADFIQSVQSKYPGVDYSDIRKVLGKSLNTSAFQDGQSFDAETLDSVVRISNVTTGEVIARGIAANADENIETDLKAFNAAKNAALTLDAALAEAAGENPDLPEQSTFFKTVNDLFSIFEYSGMMNHPPLSGSPWNLSTSRSEEDHTSAIERTLTTGKTSAQNPHVLAGVVSGLSKEFLNVPASNREGFLSLVFDALKSASPNDRPELLADALVVALNSRTRALEFSATVKDGFTFVGSAKYQTAENKAGLFATLINASDQAVYRHDRIVLDAVQEIAGEIKKQYPEQNSRTTMQAFGKRAIDLIYTYQREALP